jgi:hypothetical protein
MHDETVLVPCIAGKEKSLGSSGHHGNGAYLAWISKFSSLVQPLSESLLSIRGTRSLFFFGGGVPH